MEGMVEGLDDEDSDGSFEGCVVAVGSLDGLCDGKEDGESNPLEGMNVGVDVGTHSGAAGPQPRLQGHT